MSCFGVMKTACSFAPQLETGTMAERCFRNFLPDFDQLFSSSSISSSDDSVVSLLRESPSALSHKFLEAALSLKNEVVHATWPNFKRHRKDLSVYTGTLGTAFLCFRAHQTTGNIEDLDLCREILRDCHGSVDSMRQCPTFLCGPAGLFALGAVSANCRGDKRERDCYIEQLTEVGRRCIITHDTPYELLYGRAGFLWAVLFVNQHLGYDAVPASVVDLIIDGVLNGGRAKGTASCPLIYQWHNKEYWGAAHGLSGIMYCLLHFHLRQEDAECVKSTLKYMINNRFPESKNYPTREGSMDDRLVQWCHGAGGVTLSLCKAAKIFPLESVFRRAAVEAGNVVWQRGLLRKAGLCHGISGNAYSFLALYKLTGDHCHLHRANAFSCFLLKHARDLIECGKLHGGDHPYSLFEGLAGMACLWLDLVNPQAAKFPAFEA